MEQRILSIENVIKSQGLMDLLSQIDRLNEELNKVKGELEVAPARSTTTIQLYKREAFSTTSARW